MAPPPLPPPRGITCAVNAAPTPASPTHHKFFPNMSKPHRFSVPGGQPRHPPESPPWQGVAKGSAGALRPLNPPQNRSFSTHINILFFHTPFPNTLTFNSVSSAPRHSLSEGWHRAQQTTRARVGGGQRRASLILIFNFPALFCREEPSLLLLHSSKNFNNFPKSWEKAGGGDITT